MCAEADVIGVPLFVLMENLFACCFAPTFGLVRDSLGELCAEYVDWGDGEDEASIPVAPCTILWNNKISSISAKRKF